ncbi:MAG: DUF4236 domain-containing protein [Bacteroidaceae bacterium]|nr:DUF4236 domain-containing protein [Bacteroidaceae bacterium]
MAFRRRKTITKGLHLNLSGSGIGIGYRLFPGLSFSLNRNGVYCNTSIPGTGFYSRNKVIDGKEKQKEITPKIPQTPSDYSLSRSSFIEAEVHVHAENDGSFTYKIYDLDGNENKSFMVESEIIASRQFKEIVVRTINDCTNELTDMYKLTARPLTAIDMEKKVEESKPISSKEADKKLEKFKPIDIVPETYNVEKPTYESIRELLVAEAEEKISSIFFWTNSRKREAYVSQMLEPKYTEELVKWESAKKDFEQQQAEFVKAEKSRMQKAYDDVLEEIKNSQLEYEDAQKALDGFVNGGENYINESIDHLLACLKVPFEFSINYEYLHAQNILRIQLDLPEIEDFPKKKASLLATEEISIKDKGKIESSMDYAKSVCGMAFFFAGMMFNVSLKIRDIEISAYTQRINKATGNEEDCYIYSVVFNRSHFARINYDAIDPIEALKAQPNISKILKSFEMREIVPFSEEEVIKIANNTEELPIIPACEIVVKEKENKKEKAPKYKYDELTKDAARLIVQTQEGSTSLIQRNFGIGYNRAGRIMDELEKLGIIGVLMGAKPRDVLVHDERELEKILLRINESVPKDDYDILF